MSISIYLYKSPFVLGTYTDVNLKNIDISELGNDELEGLFSSKIYTINPDISNWDIKSIPSNFFNNNEQIEEFTIPDSITSIGESAFWKCGDLTSITIPNSVTIIGRFAFAYCRGLTSVTIPNSVTRIGDRAFEGCDKLTSVTIPKDCDIMSNSFPSGCKIIIK